MPPMPAQDPPRDPKQFHEEPRATTAAPRGAWLVFGEPTDGAQARS